MKVRLLTIITFVTACQAVPRINLFRPSDRPLMPEPGVPSWSNTFSIGYEGAFNIRGFRSNEDEIEINSIDTRACSGCDKKTCVLKIFQENQNALAALKGCDPDTGPGQLANLFNINDEAGNIGRYRACGDLSVPMNLLLSYRMYFNHGLRLELHLPVIHAELKDVCWEQVDGSLPEQRLDDCLLDTIQEVSGLDIGGWKRTGVGDFVVQGVWMRNFYQNRPLLNDVAVQARLGLMFPTGLEKDDDKILAFAFGNDGAWALQFAGGIDLTFCQNYRAGVDAEFIYMFGNTRCRRIKTAANQTDLFFLNKVPVYREFGLGQQFNVYLETFDLFNCASFKINYQFLKRNDDRVDIADDRINSAFSNDERNGALSLFDWTAHSLIFMARYEPWKHYNTSPVYPSVLAWIKYGFNGKRALLANTVGIQFNLAF